jgi:predicted permease
MDIGPFAEKPHEVFDPFHTPACPPVGCFKGPHSLLIVPLRLLIVPLRLRVFARVFALRFHSNANLSGQIVDSFTQNVEILLKLGVPQLELLFKFLRAHDGVRLDSDNEVQRALNFLWCHESFFSHRMGRQGDRQFTTKTPGPPSTDHTTIEANQFPGGASIHKNLAEWGNIMFQDVRYGFRTMLQSKGWTAVVLLSLALGIGANTALFSLIDAALLRKLPVEQPHELAFLDWVSGPQPMFVSLNGNFSVDSESASSTSFSYLTFEQFRETTQTLSAILAFSPLDRVNVNIDGNPDLVSGQLVSGNYYAALKVPSIAGRTITEADDTASAQPVAVISHRFWQRRFALDPGVIGKSVILNSVPVTIIGVTTAGFDGVNGFGSSVDFTVPIAFEPQIRQPNAYLKQPWTWWVRVMGRVKPGSTMEQVRAELEGTFQTTALDAWNAAPAQLRRTRDGGSPDTPRLRIHDGSRGFADNGERTLRLLWILMSIFGLLLLIVCVNVANLLLARSAARQREIGVRLAIGAPRIRIIRQLLTESVLVAAIAGIAGAVLAYWGKDLLAAFLPDSNRMVMDLRIDLRLLAFAAAASLLTGILFGIAPALRSTRTDVYGSIKETSRTLGRARSRLGKGLLVAQVAMSVVLLVGAGLFVGTLRNLESVNVGFNPQNLLLFQVRPIALRYDAARINRLYDQMVETINAIPGVMATTISTSPLVTNSGNMALIYAEGGDPNLRQEQRRARRQIIRENFFETIGIPILRGRNLNSADRQGAPQVAVINETFARRFFPASDPLGKRFGTTPDRVANIEIVGVVKDVQDMVVRNEITATMYISDLQQPAPLGTASFEVRTAGDPMDLAPAIREAVRQIDSNLPLFDVKTQVQLIREGVVAERLLARASGFFGGIALLLACIGLYGIMSYSVARRTAEIGVRMALGAQRVNVVWLVLRETLLLIALGAVIGLAASLGLTRLITRMLFGLTPNDPIILAAALLLMMIVAAFAGYLPARRASKIDPLIALRHE